ncbi:hypothetical protein [Botrimarina hoheduenensis]|uniref:Nickel uptake substrate-specific transmembrane region n=1 Tax=Botrimarina hoheduenensis TaxID=2528000 RepID=A0A5C5WDT2_9BACT|nr:hypothetical protein [Botrimarina hoheduenensis]TWT48800.1 hypothetical protein Pla111_05750 [Botrimarina hoheduenensis]
MASGWLLTLALTLAIPVDGGGERLASTTVTMPLVDVTLSPEGRLLGQAVTADGFPLAGAQIRLLSEDGRSIETESDEMGAFTLRGEVGFAELHGPGCSLAVNLWTAKTAPPAATTVVLLIEDVTLAQRNQPSERRGSVGGGARLVFAGR